MTVLSLPEYGRISPSNDAAREAEDSVFLRKSDFASLQKWLDDWTPPQARGNNSGLPANSEMNAPFKHGRWKREAAMKAQNFVGVVLLPSGGCLEILPKTSKILEEEGKKRSRKILLRMLRTIYGIDYKEFKDAALVTGRMPLLEIFIRCFLNEVTSLIRRGISSDYTPVEENIPCLRGRLLLPQHIRHNTVHRERFCVRYDEYLPDRPENRLVKAALQHARVISQDNENMRHCKICLDALDEIPASTNFRADIATLTDIRINI
jgi:5-methylcytosine-specific restriction enzyme subunit McrC